MTCANDGGACTKCDRGFALKASDSTCVRCKRGCTGTCDPLNINTCLSCTNGFQLVNGVCTKCATGCMACSGTTCTVCAGGYTLGTDGTCSRVCRAPCSSCNSNGVCTACITGYVLDNGKCIVDIACSTATPPNCASSCLPGSFNNGTLNTCTRCKAGCYSCTTASDCTACYAGYYLDATNCVACPSQCQTCTNAQTCG